MIEGHILGGRSNIDSSLYTLDSPFFRESLQHSHYQNKIKYPYTRLHLLNTKTVNMVSITFSIITFLLAASSIPLSAAKSKKCSGEDKFTIGLLAKGYEPFLQLKAIESSTKGYLDLVFGPDLRAPYQRNCLEGDKLLFDVDYTRKPGTYGLVLPDKPKNGSYHLGPVVAKYGGGTNGFTLLKDGKVFKMAPFGDFYICNETSTGGENVVPLHYWDYVPAGILKWGYGLNGVVEEGCVVADLQTYHYSVS